ncbi:hypothetical protein JCM19297_455 [Nonlabens ulvanivorans]|nr:hypothetical protein JCM19297_455 [Nonlabens ulvanivorans]
MLGQLPEVHMVCKSYLSTRPRNSLYFFPTGSLTRNHLGFPFAGGAMDSFTVFILQI